MVGYTTVEATLGEKVIPGLLDRYLATAAWEGAMLTASDRSATAGQLLGARVRTTMARTADSIAWRAIQSATLGF